MAGPRIPKALPILLALMASLLSACGGEDRDDARAAGFAGPQVVRFASGKLPLQGDSGLEALCGRTGDLFNQGTLKLLDEDFEDLSVWKTLEGHKGKEDFFHKIALTGDEGVKEALSLRPGMPNKGRVLPLTTRAPLTFCARLRLPEGVDEEELCQFLCIAESTISANKGLAAAAPVNYLALHNSWIEAGRQGEWLELFQVFRPRKNAMSLVPGFNGRKLAHLLPGKSEVQVDRLQLRVATIEEAAIGLKQRILGLPGAAPDAPFRHEARGELRDTLFTATPGEALVPLAPGQAGELRFGLAFPLTGSRGHCGRVLVRAALREGPDAAGGGREDKDTVLFEETIVIPENRADLPPWLERSAPVPALGKEAFLALSSRSADGRSAVTAWGAPLLVRGSERGKLPNVVLISIDTLRADRLGAYGASHPEGASPCIDGIAASAALFESAFAQAPYTLPSHVSMLSGQYPTVHGVVSSDFRINPERTPLLAPALTRAGYVTGAYTGGVYVDHTWGFDAGFDTYSEREPCLENNLEYCLSWLRANRGAPFFLFFHTYAVHDFAYRDMGYIDRFDREGTSFLHNVPEGPELQEWLDHPERHTEADLRCIDNVYAAGVRMADDAVSRLRGALDELGLWENTAVIVTSDHGKELMERGTLDHGHSLYEELIRVPLIFRPAGGMEPRRISGLVELIDIPPTVLDYLGLPRPGGIQGRSLMSLLDPKGKVEESPIFSEVDERVEIYALRTREWKLLQRPDPKRASGDEYREYELFHLPSDPGERNDLSGSSKAFESMKLYLDKTRENLENTARTLKGSVKQGEEIDRDLMERLRAQGYL